MPLPHTRIACRCAWLRSCLGPPPLISSAVAQHRGRGGASKTDGNQTWPSTHFGLLGSRPFGALHTPRLSAESRTRPGHPCSRRPSCHPCHNRRHGTPRRCACTSPLASRRAAGLRHQGGQKGSLVERVHQSGGGSHRHDVSGPELQHTLTRQAAKDAHGCCRQGMGQARVHGAREWVMHDQTGHAAGVCCVMQ